MKKLTLRAPAKINLYLRLMGQRRDGFNNLITVFHKLAISDILTFRKVRQGCKLLNSTPKVPKGRTNLIFIFMGLAKL